MEGKIKQSIKCCDFFGKMRNHFDWFSYKNDKGQKVYCMPVLKSCDGHTNLRINHCPICGKEVRDIELIGLK